MTIRTGSGNQSSRASEQEATLIHFIQTLINILGIKCILTSYRYIGDISLDMYNYVTLSTSKSVGLN